MNSSILSTAQLPSTLAYHHITKEHGLSNNNVFYMYKDSRKFLWLGSKNGLNRFDGINVKVYKPTNSNINGTSIFNIVEDKRGNLWIGTQHGLNEYIRKTDNFKSHNFTTNRLAYPIAFDNNEKLWVIGFVRGKNRLYAFNPQTYDTTFITDKIFNIV
jgi:ligand-binding sensor domain-containing protein